MGVLLRVVAGTAGTLVVLSAAFVLAFRWQVPTVLRAVRRFNRRVSNPRQLLDAGRPGASASVVQHVGRRSGNAYRTPVVAVPTGEGFLVALPYGATADWVQNVLAAGTATVEHAGHAIPVDRPLLVSAPDAEQHFARNERWMHRIFGVDTFLHVQDTRPAPAPTTPAPTTGERDQP